jgi:hypothetical protein
MKIRLSSALRAVEHLIDWIVPMNPRVVPDLRIYLIVIVVAGAIASTAVAQSPTALSPVGVWRGTSVCLVHPSACNEEIVVYRIAPMKSADSLTIDARKIVRGDEQEMGDLRCRLIAVTGELTCAIPMGVWHFRARGDSLTGELRLTDNTRFREVRARRAPPAGRE